MKREAFAFTTGRADDSGSVAEQKVWIPRRKGNTRDKHWLIQIFQLLIPPFTVPPPPKLHKILLLRCTIPLSPRVHPLSLHHPPMHLPRCVVRQILPVVGVMQDALSVRTAKAITAYQTYLGTMSSLLKRVGVITGAAPGRIQMKRLYLTKIWPSEVGRHWYEQLHV